MELTLENAGFTQKDRTGLTVFGSVLIHLFIILGIGFVMVKEGAQIDPGTEIRMTLVQQESESEPVDADVLAQANQEGGGDETAYHRATGPMALTEQVSEFILESYTPPLLSNPATGTPAAMVVDSDTPDSRLTPDQENPSETSGEARTDSIPLPPAASALTAEIDRFFKESQELPKQKFISSRTREHIYATYMEAWRAQVERVGNLNYPEAAKARKLSGSLVLHVALASDGRVDEIRVARSSGQKVLDDAAIRIVQMAAPYPPFSEEIRKETDILHITRTWQFLTSNELISR